MPKAKPKSAAPVIVLPPIGWPVQVRSPFFQGVTAGLVVGLYGADTNDVVVQAFPLQRDPIQIPAIPFFESEPAADIKSAVWPIQLDQIKE
jgi:hypothetical protein